MKTRKKAQITIFIILGILILMIGVSFFLIKSNPLNQTLKISPDIKPVYSFIQECIDETSKQAVFYTSERGGFYKIPENSFDEVTPYYLYEYENYMPSKERIESEISDYINENIDKCLNDFQDFSEYEIQTNKNNLKTTTKINKNEVIININYPISISKQEKTYMFENFDSSVSAKLGVVYDAVYEFMQEQIKKPTALNPNYLYQLSLENNINIQMSGFIEDSIIFIITEDNFKQNESEFMFIFANKYIPVDGEFNEI